MPFLNFSIQKELNRSLMMLLKHFKESIMVAVFVLPTINVTKKSASGSSQGFYHISFQRDFPCY